LCWSSRQVLTQVRKKSQLRLILLTIPFLTVLYNGATIADDSHHKRNSWRNDTTLKENPRTGKTRLVSARRKKPLNLAKNKSVADHICETYAPAFGVRNPARELKLKIQKRHNDRVTTYRYQQQHNGIPIIGAELVAGVDSSDQFSFMSGETVADLSLNTTPKLTAKEAKQIALSAVSKWRRIAVNNLTATDPVLSIYKPDLLSPNTKPANVVWQLSVTAEKINELLFIDANNGLVSFHLNQVHSALNRQTYSANNTANYQSQLICDEADPSCSAGDDDAKAAHRYAEDTYLFYFNTHSRDGIDNAGGAIISSVHVGPTFNNAAWTGSQMIYGDGFSQADDVVAHELTHGVTQKESNLYYYYQSGAINESFSDLWGEFVDQSNSSDPLSGTDTAAVKWLLGEDIPGVGAIRNMQNPPAFGDPDKMTSSNYFTGSDDNGGVHTNSGINNKAVYLMTDGGTFNGETVTGIGIENVAKLYYEVQTKHLTSGSDYLDLYNALTQACTDLVSESKLNSSDCTQVAAALRAVEMNQQPVKGFNIEASVCPSGSSKLTTVFNDTIESGLGNWTFSHDPALRDIDWRDWLSLFPGSPFATSGTHSLYASDVDSLSDQYAKISVSLPTVLSDEKIFLHFKHVIDLEANETQARNDYFDGAVLEYSTNNGSSWQDANNLISDGKPYTGVIDSSYSSPLAGRLAYSSVSNGFVSTRVNLSAFTGSAVQLRWRMASDSSVAASGWIIDDVDIYTCKGAVNSLPVARAGSDITINSAVSVNLNANSSSDADANIASYTWEQVGGKLVSLSGSSSATASFTAPTGNRVLTFKLTVTDSDGQTDTDLVNVIINTIPVANAGSDIVAITGTVVTLDATSSSDIDGSIVKYTWAQTSGDKVTLSSTAISRPSFTAPAANQTLTFALIVTDNDGHNSVVDNVSVKVNPVPPSGGGGGILGCSLGSGSAKSPFNPFMFLLLAGLSLIHFVRRSAITE